MKTSAITLAIAILGVLHGPLIATLLTRAKSRRKQPAALPGYPGVRLRVSTPSGVVLEADSNELFYRAWHKSLDWADLIAGGDAGATEFSTVPVKIEVKPIRLSEAPE